VFFALWMFALKPGSSNNSSGGASSSQGLGGFKSDIQKAHQAVATSNASNAASGNENATSSSGGTSASQSTATATKTTASSSAKPSTSSTAKTSSTATTKPAKHAAARTKIQHHSLAANLKTVEAAVNAHKVVALLFYNPQAADDEALKRELASVPTHRGHVVKLEIPLNEAANFTAVTQQVPVNLSPTLVLVSRTGAATEIVGYSDPFEIDQRVDDALAATGSAAS
jgi:hypothetical protein